MKKIILFILTPIFFTTFGEFLLKDTTNHIFKTLTNPSILDQLKEPYIWLAYLLIIGGGLLWLVAMSKYELSFLYPFLSINYVAIILGSQWILNESVSIYRYVSIAFIISGLIFISKSQNIEVEKKKEQ